MSRLCAQILPTGKPCAQLALKGLTWCRFHKDPAAQRRTTFMNHVVQSIPEMDLSSLADVLLGTTIDLRARRTPPAHAEVVFKAVVSRIEQLETQPR